MEPSRDRLRTPRAAGLAGIAFAVLLAAAIVLMRLAIPEGVTDAGGDALSPDRRRAVRMALELVPFAGIFFLWFMGALRAQVGEREDKLVATVFLGSGLVFVATMFGAASAAGSILEDQQPSEFGRNFAYTLLTTYSMRMAAVFIFATSMIGHRLGVIPRPLTVVGYAAGLVLLFAGPSFPWSELVFPAWSALIGLHLLRVRMKSRPQPADVH
ncbi:hypothetical protein AB0K47_25075 [Streptomyces tirandamycinicus]|uniref:DUF4386 domain-containing protein n=1 Tax=Streptomyces tirandamycinicus TaxID=2174846 RepID=A0A2S1SZP9_9ACTN|nr:MULTISPECIES: hypothetical protein [Streptomyces]AWI31885.1 hypothetical protein DDW44_26160 [Streptomyces tirandamycinicus]MCY0982008.1 hypothetical protein [Streptomyces tirandamycinicus]NNJ08289.1 hypothetical protein [Streptomyces sp. PKU-MA01144]TFE48462.1 hypothetical protein E3E14_17910 [Streptomyces sp. ICN441]